MKIPFTSFSLYIILIITVEAQTIPRPTIPAPQGLAVNSFTGNLFYQRNEQSLRGTGYRIYQTFYYNSAQDTLNYGYGKGWSFYYNVSYRVVGDTVLIKRADAKRDTFLLRSGSYQSPTGVYDVLTKSGSQYVLTSKAGEQRVFGDASHRKLTRMQDANGNFISIDYTNGSPVKITNSSGRSLLLTWSNGLLITATDGADPAKKYTYTYNSTKDLIAVTDPLQGRKSFTYSNHYLVRLGDENNSPVVIYYFGSGGRVRQITSCNTEQRFTFLDEQHKTFVSQKTESSNSVVGYQFDTAGRLSAITDPDGNKAEFTYDNSNNLLTQKDFKGTITTFTYDSKGNLLKVIDPAGSTTEYAYEPVFNNPVSIKDAKSRTTTLGYDTKGNLTSIVRPGDLTDSFTYDAAGRRLTAKNASNNTTTYQYNTDGDLTKIQFPLGSVQYQYNGNCCKVSKITDANGNTLDMTYDLLNRTKTVKDAQGNTTSYDYDAVGNVIKETDPNGNTKQYDYDGLNRLISVKLPVGTWYYDYDGQSNLVKITDANGHTTRYGYDKKNQLVKETDPLGNSVDYLYDVSGNLIKRNDPNGNVVNYKYDILNRLIEKNYIDNADKYSYDEVGNLISAYNNNIAYSFEYDNLNRLLKKNILNWNKSLSYTYDAVGSRKTMTNHDGGITTYTYDANNRLINLKNPANLTTTFDYDAGGRLKKQTNGNSTFSTYHYDAAGRLDSLINWKNNTEKISFFYYTFDQYGNRKTVRDKRGLNTYMYDAAYRLTNVAYADGGTESFTIDGSGNRTQRVKNGVATGYTYDSADQIQTAGPGSFTVDANGNTIGQNSNSQRSYIYDGENRLSEVALKLQQKIQYKYDPFGDKIEKKNTLSVVTRMIYDGANLLSELDNSNVTKNLYSTAFEMDTWLSMHSEGNSFFYHKDGLNSIAELTGLNGSMINQYNYDVYGNLIFQTGEANNKILYTGRLYESDSKLYDHRNRFYNPDIGRFINKDLFGGYLDNPLSINKFNYTGSNPTNYIDPNGRSWAIVIGAVIVGYFTYETAIGMAERAGNAGDDRENRILNPDHNPNTEDRSGGLFKPTVENWKDGTTIPGTLYNPRTGTGFDLPAKLANWGNKLKKLLDPKGQNENPSKDKSKLPTFGPTPVTAFDPNEIIGPAGYDNLKWVSIKQNLSYKILFENDPDFATAPAQNVTVYAPIHPKLNPASLRLSDFGFGSFNFTVPENTSIYSNRLDVRDSLGVFVDITAGLDVANRRAFWIFQSIDPATGLAATLPAGKGFLPVNDSTRHNGEGFVTFTVLPSALAQTRDTVTAQASIIFDTEGVVRTNKWVNTIDAVAPLSNINALASTVDSVFNVSWVGQDDANGSGVRDYILYVSKNNGPFTLYKDKLTTTIEQLTGEPGSTLSFYTRAADNTGNVESMKTIGDRVVTIKIPSMAGVTCPNSSINLSVTSVGTGATYQWQVDTGSGFANVNNSTVYTGTTSPQLIIQSAPSSYSGYQYRCQITSGATVSYGPVRKLKFASSWLGTAGESWHNPANWSCGIVPDEYTNVTVPGDAPAQPALTADGTCSSLMMTKQGAIKFKGAVKLKLTGK